MSDKQPLDPRLADQEAMGKNLTIAGWSVTVIALGLIAIALFDFVTSTREVTGTTREAVPEHIHFLLYGLPLLAIGGWLLMSGRRATPVEERASRSEAEHDAWRAVVAAAEAEGISVPSAPPVVTEPSTAQPSAADAVAPPTADQAVLPDCAQCGAVRDASDKFCRLCGSSFD